MPVHATFAADEAGNEPVAIVTWPDERIMGAFLAAATQDRDALPFAWESMRYHGDVAPESDLPESARYVIVVEAYFPGMSMN